MRAARIAAVAAAAAAAAECLRLHVVALQSRLQHFCTCLRILCSTGVAHNQSPCRMLSGVLSAQIIAPHVVEENADSLLMCSILALSVISIQHYTQPTVNLGTQAKSSCQEHVHY